MRRKARVDLNHGAIVEALRAAGWQVLSLAPMGRGVPDLLCRKPATGEWRLVEVKRPKGTLTADQDSFQQQGWPVTVITTVEQAMTL